MATAAAHPDAPLANNLRPGPNDVHGSKRNKAKKSGPDSQKLVNDTIASLETKVADDKEDQKELERESRKAHRDATKDLPQELRARADALSIKLHNYITELKRTERDLKKAKARAEAVQKEKDTVRTDLTKMTSNKDKLERLCREMQKDNKKLKDDNQQLRDTETSMREDLHNRLEGMVNDVQEFVVSKENPELLPANMEADDMFREKFKSFIDQYELRELQFHSLLRTKELELQFCNARYEQQRRAQEQEATKSRQLTSQVSTFSQTETELRSQLNIYVDKFKQVEDTLNNSNDLFLTFRREMEEMSKKTKRLEKENHSLTRRHQATSENILQMAEERQRAARDLDALRRKNENLERLCRGMQAQGRAVAAPAGSATRPAPPTASANKHHALPNGQTAHNLDRALLEEVGTESSYNSDDEDEDDDSDRASDGARESALHNLDSSPPGSDPAPAEATDEPDTGGAPSVLQVAAGASDLQSAVALTKAQRAQMPRSNAGVDGAGTGNGTVNVNGQPVVRAKHVNGQRRAAG